MTREFFVVSHSDIPADELKKGDEDKRLDQACKGAVDKAGGQLRGEEKKITLDGKHPEGWFPEQKIGVKEAIEAYTKGSAFAAFRESDLGTLEAGKRCYLAIWSIERPAELAYRIGFNPLQARVWNGQ